MTPPDDGLQPPALTLASRSPQRRAILSQLGVEFRVFEPDADERSEGEPRALVIENALRKARSVPADAPGPVLGADTTVVLDGEPIGKPDDRGQAEAILGRLSGRTHEVLSGIALIGEGSERSGAALTRVRMRALEAPELDWYLDSEEWRGRAGGYAIQGRGAALVEAIEGDFWNVVGLPVAELVRLEPALLRGG